MKRVMTFLACSILAGLVQAGDCHTFTDAQGRTIKAKLLEVDPAKGRVKIERKDGKTLWVSPTVFSDADREHIKQWIVASQVLSEKNLRISFKKLSDPVEI